MDVTATVIPEIHIMFILAFHSCNTLPLLHFQHQSAQPTPVASGTRKESIAAKSHTAVPSNTVTSASHKVSEGSKAT